MIKRYTLNILIAIDQLANAVLLGDPDETISSRIGKLVRANRAKWWVKHIAMFLDWIDKNHCIDAIEEDEGEAAVLGNEHFKEVCDDKHN